MFSVLALAEDGGRPSLTICQPDREERAGSGKFCAYCKILNHSQEDCRKRIKDNKPCVTNSGKLYWPKVNSTNDNPNTVQQNSNPNAIESVFH